MTGNWIPRGNDQSRLQGQLSTLVAQLLSASQIATNLTNIMSQMAPASDYTTIETEFGLAAGQGQTLHDVVGTANTALQGGGILALLQRFG